MARALHDLYNQKSREGTSIMETVKKTLEMPSDTLQALERLAQITGAKDGVAELIQDALRIYEWVVYQQAKGNVITATPMPSSDRMKNYLANPATPDVEVLAPQFDEKHAEEAKRFFAQAA